MNLKENIVSKGEFQIIEYGKIIHKSPVIVTINGDIIPENKKNKEAIQYLLYVETQRGGFNDKKTLIFKNEDGEYPSLSCSYNTKGVVAKAIMPGVKLPIEFEENITYHLKHNNYEGITKDSWDNYLAKRDNVDTMLKNNWNTQYEEQKKTLGEDKFIEGNVFVVVYGKKVLETPALLDKTGKIVVNNPEILERGFFGFSGKMPEVIFESVLGAHACHLSDYKKTPILAHTFTPGVQLPKEIEAPINEMMEELKKIKPNEAKSIYEYLNLFPEQWEEYMNNRPENTTRKKLKK